MLDLHAVRTRQRDWHINILRQKIAESSSFERSELARELITPQAQSWKGAELLLIQVSLKSQLRKVGKASIL